MKTKAPKPIKLCPHSINAKFCSACNKVTRHLSADQAEAYRVIASDEFPFMYLTGQAGSGKSYLIDHIRSTLPGVSVCATTGAAAQLIQGRTLHSFAGIHPNFGVVDSKKADARIRACKLLIVDEISMADPNLILQLFKRFQRAGKSPKLLLVGDFLQLPPVEGTPLFEAHFWDMFKVVSLSQQHRQKDESFISALNDIRIGKMTDQVKELIRDRTVAELPDDCTQLVATRDMAEQINVSRLSMLEGQLCTSQWIVEMGQEDVKIDLSKSRLVEFLKLKVGARVVLLTNEPDGLWVNGSTGSIVKIVKGSVSVLLDKGGIVSISKIKDDMYDGDGNVTCSIIQYPIMLAFSITSHRAQGMSLDRVGVNLNRHFAPGQTYVALSRCKTREGLFICGTLDRIIVDPKALAYCGIGA